MSLKLPKLSDQPHVHQFDRNQRGRHLEALKNIIILSHQDKPPELETIQYLITSDQLASIEWAIERIEDLENDVATLAAEIDELHDDMTIDLLGEDR